MEYLSVEKTLGKWQRTLRVWKNKPYDDCFPTKHLNKLEETL